MFTTMFTTMLRVADFKNQASRMAVAVGLSAVCAMLGACASSPEKTDKARMTITAQAAVNPDANGRPSPIVVRVYQLKADDKFGSADFFALFDDDQKELGADLLGREEVELAPGEKKELQFAVKRDAKFVGVMAAYRDIRNSRWRVVKPAPKKGWLDVFGKDAITVDLGRDAAELTVKD
jgi:type VI secretion system protein VasD